MVRKTFAELLVLHTAEERGIDSEIKKRIHAVAKLLPEPVKGRYLYDVLNIFGFFDPLTHCIVQNSRNLLPFNCFFGDPLPHPLHCGHHISMPPVKATEFIRKLSGQMLGDPNLLHLMEKVVDQDTSCAECMQAVVSTVAFH